MWMKYTIVKTPAKKPKALYALAVLPEMEMMLPPMRDPKPFPKPKWMPPTTPLSVAKRPGGAFELT